MELLFPTKLQFLPSKTGNLVVLPLLSPKLQFRCRRVGSASVSARQIKLRSELNGKVNGALSGESDPRLIDRQKALEAAMNDINSSFGKGSVTRLGSAGGALVETFPSGCLTLDFALGGGLPKGRIVEIYGPESSGKTTLALHAMAEVQRQGGHAMLVDAEHAFDAAYSKALGVDVENLIVCQPDNGEMALEIADRMCRSGAIDLICVDSVSALTPRAEIEGEIGMQQMGLQARLMSQALRKMSGNASKAGCTLIFLNQIRHKIGVYYGNPEVTSGGIALKFFASLRLEIRPIGKVKSAKGDEDIGLRVRVRVQKSKILIFFRFKIWRQQPDFVPDFGERWRCRARFCERWRCRARFCERGGRSWSTVVLVRDGGAGLDFVPDFVIPATSRSPASPSPSPLFFCSYPAASPPPPASASDIPSSSPIDSPPTRLRLPSDPDPTPTSLLPPLFILLLQFYLICLQSNWGFFDDLGFFGRYEGRRGSSS